MVGFGWLEAGSMMKNGLAMGEGRLIFSTIIRTRGPASKCIPDGEREPRF